MSTAAALPSLHPPPHHSAEHWGRVRDEVARAVDEVPLYCGRAAPPASTEPQAIASWLSAMPTVQKRDLRRGFPKSLVRRGTDLKAEMGRGTVEIIATSGTTENRLQVLWGWSWWDPQEREAMRLNARVAAAMGDGFREAVLTTPVCGGNTCHIGNLSREERTIDGMLFLNQVADPTHWRDEELARMVAEWNDLGPDGVESDPAYLAALCRHVARSGGTLRSPRFITLTYEQTTRGHRRQINQVVNSPLYQLYGATEAGVLFMQCEHGRLHHNARHSHIELVDVDARGRLGRILVTTLGREWMPLVRYDIGDVVRLAEERACGCGLPEEGYLLERIEGRIGECVTAGGRVITPAMIDDAVDAAAPHLEKWQLVSEHGRYTLKGVGDGVAAAAQALEPLLGAAVEARSEQAILPEPSGKYRLVKA